MKWTREKPTKRGHYWFKHDMKQDFPFVFRFVNEHSYMVGGDVFDEEVFVGYGMFSDGPIPEPEEP